MNLRDSFFPNLPRLLAAFLILVLAWFLKELLKALSQKTTGRWQSSSE